MEFFSNLLGPTLTNAKGESLDTAAALQNKVVGLYASAHWCPPCRGFTPELAKIYTAAKAAGKNFEIVFVSSDKEEEEFTEYLGEMPWLAVPFAEAAKNAKKSVGKKYKISGIPTLVLLNPDGSTITTEGRAAVGKPLEQFPWIPPTRKEVFAEAFKNGILTKSGDRTTIDTLTSNGSHLALYFSAHWCPPCKQFTPMFANTYKALKESASTPNFEVVFVSSDRNQKSFDEYWGEQPWAALPFEDREGKEVLSDHFGVRGIPTLVVLDSDLNIVNDNARGIVSNDPTGAKFPWAPPLVSNIDESADGVNDTPSIVALCEEAPDEWDAVEATLEEAAKAAKVALGGEPFKFFIAQETGAIGSQIRNLCGLGKPAQGSVEWILLDLGDEGGYYNAPGALTSQAVGELLASYRKGALERQQVKGR